jgi:BirA family transcriptional regulator, biotin operon repressor / biotin---[acetyl-CoA-carboxylase] ligase
MTTPGTSADTSADSWLGEPVDHWRLRWGVPHLHVHTRVGSTNDVARDLALQGAPEGTTVVADAQDHGRGRRGREWLAPAGTSLLLSMIFRPATPGAETLLSLRLGLAAARAIEAAASVQVRLKWPNDLLVDGLKVAGILCEGAVENGRSLHLVAGIGINVSQDDDAWPPELRGQASSLESRAQEPVDRARLAGVLVQEWIATASLDSAALAGPELDEFGRRDALFGQPIYVNGRYAGTARGIQPDGALRATTPEDSRAIVAGTIRTTPDTDGPT